MVQLERVDSRSPGRGKTDDSSSIRRPSKMFAPDSVTRIEERRDLGRERIGRRAAIRLERVAPPTSEPQVFALGLAARGFGDEMLNFERDPKKPFGTEAVSASLVSVTPHLSPQIRRDVRGH
jgi:hypothetical protein